MTLKTSYKPTFTVFVSFIIYCCSCCVATASVTDNEADSYTEASTAAEVATSVIQPEPAPETLSKKVSFLPYKAIYQANFKGLSATLTRSLQNKDDGLWQLENNASLFLATIEESSLLQINQQGVEPLNYRYKNPLSSKRNSSLQFDWANNNVRDNANEGKSITLKNNSYDKLSFQIQLRMDLIQQGQQFKSKQYHLVDKDRLKTYQVEVIGEEVLVTPAGKFDAIKLKQYRAGKNKHTLIWMAKDWQYMILRLERFEDGESKNSLQLLEAQFNDEPIIGLNSAPNS